MEASDVRVLRICLNLLNGATIPLPVNQALQLGSAIGQFEGIVERLERELKEESADAAEEG